MSIETVKVLKSIKAGDLVYLEGEIFNAPDIPSDLLEEIRAGANTVEVVNRQGSPLPKVKHTKFDYESRPEMKTPDISTASTIQMRDALLERAKEALAAEVLKPKKKQLIKRKKKKLIKRKKK
jgi:hypothetical protein